MPDLTCLELSSRADRRRKTSASANAIRAVSPRSKFCIWDCMLLMACWKSDSETDIAKVPLTGRVRGWGNPG